MAAVGPRKMSLPLVPSNDPGTNTSGTDKRVQDYTGIRFDKDKFGQFVRELTETPLPLRVRLTPGCLDQTQQDALARIVKMRPGLTITDTTGNPFGSIYMNWGNYYEKLLEAHPNGDFTLKPTVVIALQCILKESNSPPELTIELGAGIGDDTLPLVKEGGCRNVLAIDINADALETLKKSLPDELRDYVTTSIYLEGHGNLQGKAALFVASYTLPYVLPDKFNSTWEECTSLLKPGGYFAGHFFGPISDKRPDPSMTYHTEEEARRLFKSDFEIVWWQTDPEGTKVQIYGGTEKPAWGALHHVVARKKLGLNSNDTTSG